MSNNAFRNLVFEGGGVKGIAYGGAIEQLESRGILQNIQRVAGTSAGAITAVLLALGYSADDTSRIVAETDFNDFADDSFGVIRDTARFIKDYGWHKGDAFKKWMGKLIKAKTGNSATTFRQLEEMQSQHEGIRALFLVATNLSDQTAEIFSASHTPDVPIRDAARMSMSIPLFFRCVRRGEDEDVMVDGGVSWNYALNIFDDVKYLDNQSNGDMLSDSSRDSYAFNHETLGFRLDSREEINYNTPNWRNVPAETDHLFEYTKALLGFMLEMANKKHLKPQDWRRTVFIDTLDVRSIDFGLGRDKVNALVQQGREGVQAYFEWRDRQDLPKPT